jgi:hypothetical protein
MRNALEQDPTDTTVAPKGRPVRRTVQALAAVGVVAVIAAGCGSTTSTKPATPAANTGTAPASSPTTKKSSGGYGY